MWSSTSPLPILTFYWTDPIIIMLQASFRKFAGDCVDALGAGMAKSIRTGSLSPVFLATVAYPWLISQLQCSGEWLALSKHSITVNSSLR